MFAILAVLASVAGIVAITRGERGVGHDADEKRQRKDHKQYALAHRMTSDSGNWKQCTPELAERRAEFK
jgi:hypothetical protein